MSAEEDPREPAAPPGPRTTSSAETTAADGTPRAAAPGRSASVAAPILAGIVCGIVGFTSSFAIVLAGLAAVGASPLQASSGLLVLCLTMGLGCVLFSLRLRMPITMAWSTPGAALLASAAIPAAGFAGAVGAFIACGFLLALCALVKPLGRLVQAIPDPLASAMLAGVLLHLVLAPVTALAADPAALTAPILVWLALSRLAPRWSVPGALAAAIIVMAVRGAFGAIDPAIALPTLALVVPAWDPGALLAIALPLFIVTMTSQNVPGIAVLASFGYRPGMRGPLLYTGAASAAGALGGAHAINLAAISAALAAGPEAGPDPSRRWIAGVSCGLTYLALGPVAGLATALAHAAPAGLIEAIAGLALIATFAASASAALGPQRTRIAGAVTLIVGASGLVLGGIGAAFWSLLAGLLVHAVLSAGKTSDPEPTAAGSAAAGSAEPGTAAATPAPSQ